MAAFLMDAATITRDELAAKTVGELSNYIPALVNAYHESKDPTRLELRNEFYNKAYGLDQYIRPGSHSDYIEGSRTGPWAGPDGEGGVEILATPEPEPSPQP